MSLDEELDGLYAAPLGEFVGRRNELAKRLKAEGEKQAAGRVKALPKPSLTAWAVNQLAFHAAEELAALMAAGARVRAAHLAAPAEQQAAAKARRAAVAALLGIAGEILAQSGQTMNRSHKQRISQSLEALSSREPESDEPGAGRLSRDLEPAGFDALAGLALALEKAQADRPRPAPPKQPPAKPSPKAAAGPAKPQAERQAAAAARRQDAVRRTLDRQIEEADGALSRLAEKREGLSSAAESAAAELAEAKRAAAERVEAAIEAERLAREARRSAEEAGEKAQRARFAAESASAALKRADNEREKLRRKREGLEQERSRL